jgi:hypothetical protein
MFLLKAVVWRLAGRYRGHGYINYIYTHTYMYGVVYPVIFYEISSHYPEKK